jgi:acetyl/propionyl-CoA carboxylase alpha subunit
MLAKVIVWAETREAARRRAIAALRDYAILGIHTNIPFLLRILDHPQFIDATIDTGFLDREGANIAAGLKTDLPEAAMVALKKHQRTFGTTGTRGTNPLGTLGTVGTLGTDPFLSLRNWRG